MNGKTIDHVEKENFLIVKKLVRDKKILIFSDKKIYYQLDNRINEL